MLKNSILQLSGTSLILILILSNTILGNGVTADAGSSSWIGFKDGTESGNYSITNTTGTQLQIDGIRVNINGTTGNISDGGSSFNSVTSVPDGNGSDRFEIDIPTMDNGGLPMNIFNPARTHVFKMQTTEIPEGVDWTPTNPQFLVKTGSLAEQKVNKDISGLTLSQLDSVSNTPDFYNENLFVLDTLGIHGSIWGAGFVDTWYDQDKDLPIWQIQVALPKMVDSSVSPVDTFKIWNTPARFEPDSMDSRDNVYGVGPLFMMGAALGQEYMNIDMQYLLATGFQESKAGIQAYTQGGGNVEYNDTVIYSPNAWITGGKTTGGNLTGYSYKGSGDTTVIYIKEKWQSILVPDVNSYPPNGIAYYNHNRNDDLTRGPMHFIESSYKSYVYEAYPKFFPFDNTYQPSPKYITSSTGGCEMNSPQIANAYLLSSLYMWYTWQLVVAKLGEDALDFFKDATNREISAQMVSWAWNKGFNGSFATFVLSPDGSKLIDEDVDYVGLVWNGVNHLENANRKSTVNGGDHRIYDGKISKQNLEALFFGEGGNPTAGNLGTAGILHHFNLTQAKRVELWDEVDSAFNMLKGRAPSTKGTEFISYRYDYLGVLRIAKKFLDLSIPIPKVEEFKNWTTTGTEPDPNAKSSDKVYPYLVLKDKQKVGNTVQVKAEVKDNRYLNIDSAAVVEWTMDPDWGKNNWYAAVKESGADTLQASYTANLDQTFINNNLPADKDTGIAWIRVSDANFNSTLDTIHVVRDENIIVLDPPTFDSCIALDNNGDGQADKIELYLTKASGGEELSNHSNLKYSWPTTTNLLIPGQISGSSSPLTITDPGKLTGGEGLGKIEFSYNTTDFSESILDRVGPAIDSLGAELSLGATSSDKDTLTITFSENVSGFSNSDIVLAFKKNETDSDTAEVSTASLSGSGDKWVFLFDNGKLQDYNWVKIVSNSALVDNNSNKADKNNQLVKIEKSGGNIPLWSVGYIEDTNGDGYGDKITYKISEGSGSDPLNFSDVDAIDFKFNTMGSEASISIDSIYPNKSSASTTISFNVDNSVTNDYTGIVDGDASVTLKGVETVTLTGKIEDRIGPAISIAEFIITEDSSPCTLKVSLTEAIDDISDISTAWFKIGGTDQKAQGIIKLSSNGKQWGFILDESDIVAGDKISLISSSGMVDKSAQDNPPLETEKDIAINKLSSAIEIDSIKYFDNNADGTMDFIEIIFNKTIDQEDDIEKMSFDIVWLDKDSSPVTIKVDGIELSKKDEKSAVWSLGGSGYELKENLTILGSNYGEVSFTQEDPSDSTSTVTLDYDNSIAIDMMAPVIVNADYYIFKKGEDTLLVTFSEEITKSIPSNTPFKYQDNSKDIQAVHLGSFTSSDIIDFIKIGGETPEDGDLININSSAGITGSNSQSNPTNKYVKLNIYSEIEITDISYHEDDDPFDGLIDLIIVKTDVEVPDGIISKMSDNIQLNEDRKFNAIESKDITKLSDGDLGFQIKVSQKEDAEKNTATTMKDVLDFTNKIGSNNNFIQRASHNVSDSLAPVIASAIVRPVEIDESNYQNEPKDTLYITFTENVNFSTMESNPFNYKNSSNKVINIDLEKDSNIKGFLIDYKSTKLMPNDSIIISTSGNISDAINNRQINENIYIPVQVEAVEVHWKDAVFPNPINKVLSENDIKVLQDELKIPEDKIKKRSQAIIISSFGLPPAKDEVSMTIKIFDALGHILAEGDLETNGSIWYYIWDCKNLKKRDVGSGVYIATVKISPETMGTIDNIIKIGIQN